MSKSISKKSCIISNIGLTTSKIKKFGILFIIMNLTIQNGSENDPTEIQNDLIFHNFCKEMDEFNNLTILGKDILAKKLSSELEFKNKNGKTDLYFINFGRVFKNDLNENTPIYKDIYFLKQFNLSSQNEDLAIPEFIDCVYQENFYSEESETNIDGLPNNVFDIYIIKESFNSDLSNPTTRMKFGNYISNYDRFKHYLSLIKTIKLFRDQNLVHLNIKPENIMITEEIIDKKSKFKLKLQNFELMTPINAEQNKGTEKIYFPPGYYNTPSNQMKTNSRTERDIYALLFTIAQMEYKRGINYRANPSDTKTILATYNNWFKNTELRECLMPKFKCTDSYTLVGQDYLYCGFTNVCFDKLLERIYIQYTEDEFSHSLISQHITGIIDSAKFKSIAENKKECKNIICFILTNMKYDYRDFKSIEDLEKQMEKLIKIEKPIFVI